MFSQTGLLSYAPEKIYYHITLPETNSKFNPEKRPKLPQKEKWIISHPWDFQVRALG